MLTWKSRCFFSRFFLALVVMLAGFDPQRVLILINGSLVQWFSHFKPYPWHFLALMWWIALFATSSPAVKTSVSHGKS